MLRTRLTELFGCLVPLQQAGMGVSASPPLAVAVAEAGAIGMLGGVQLPAPVLADMLDGIRQRTTGVFGVNFLMPFLDREAVRMAASRANLVEFFYGDPDASLVQLVHDGGARVCWQVGSGEEAVAAAAAGCDVIVAQGVEAGGHVRGQVGLLPLLDEVLNRVSVPVIAAGGIGTGRAMAAALAAGAAGVRVGTRFAVAEEADTHPVYAEALIQAAAEDTVVTETFSAMWPHAPHRVLRSCVDAAQSFTGEFVGEMTRGGRRMPLPRFAPPNPGKETTGAVEAMALYAGQSVGAVRQVQPAEAIVHELAEEAELLLRRWC